MLTSHSMEECEALCTKIGIMVNGKFKCLGSLQHLKSRFGQGYVVMLKVTPPAPGNTPESTQKNTPKNSPGNTSENIPLNAPGNIPVNTPMNASIVRVKEFMSKVFSSADVIEEHQGFLKYHVGNNSSRLSELFGALEENSSRLNIVDYSVSQTTLDQIFVKFAKEQHDQERVNGNRRFCCCCC